MSNLDLSPAEVSGGPRAMPVRRSLPQQAQSLIGAWCFADHTGLQTVSWLEVNRDPHTLPAPDMPAVRLRSRG